MGKKYISFREILVFGDMLFFLGMGIALYRRIKYFIPYGQFITYGQYITFIVAFLILPGLTLIIFGIGLYLIEKRKRTDNIITPEQNLSADK